MHATTASECGCGHDWAEARRAAQRLLKAYPVHLRKALNPLDDDDFLLIVQQLTDELTAIVGPVETAAIEAALAALDVDYAMLTAAELSQISRAANLALKDIPAKVLPQITGTINMSLTDTVGKTKVSASATYGWAINTAFDAVDQNMVNAMSRLGSWVLDEYGNRAAMFTSGAQQIIQQGLADGLRNKDIARDLKALGDRTTGARSLRYWNLVATNASNRARGFGHLRSMDDAGVQNYIYSAILDERTSLQCRALDGTVFPVSTGLKAYSDLELATQGDPQAAEKFMPFVKQRSLGGGNYELFVEPPGSARTVIAEAIGSAVGVADVRGTFQNVLSPGQLAAAGVTVPPIHHACRSTILPEI